MIEVKWNNNNGTFYSIVGGYDKKGLVEYFRKANWTIIYLVVKNDSLETNNKKYGFHTSVIGQSKRHAFEKLYSTVHRLIRRGDYEK